MPLLSCNHCSFDTVINACKKLSPLYTEHLENLKKYLLSTTDDDYLLPSIHHKAISSSTALLNMFMFGSYHVFYYKSS